MRIVQIADNAGATDEHRALNYLVVRYPRIYEKAVYDDCYLYCWSIDDLVWI